MNTVPTTTTSAIASAQSGLSAAQKRMDVAAFNIANMSTEGFERSVVTQQVQPSAEARPVAIQRQDAGEGYVEDRVNQIEAMYSFKANLKTIETAHKMIGSLIDLRA